MLKSWKGVIDSVLVVVALAGLLAVTTSNGNGFARGVEAFSPRQPTHHHRYGRRQQRGWRHVTESTIVTGDNPPAAGSSTTTIMARYGPPQTPDNDEEYTKWEAEQTLRIARQTTHFQTLLSELSSPNSTYFSRPENIPGLLSRNIDLLLNMKGYEGAALMKDALAEAEATGDEETVERVATAVDCIATFVEEFVEQAKTIDDAYKQLLGKIIRCIAGKGGKGDGARDAEVALDEMLRVEKENFTPGFLRHLEGECARIASAPKTSPESIQMLQTIRIVQTRIIEELGKDLGEGAMVLGQLLGYEENNERMAVLSAGLTVRGVEFGEELLQLTEEALEGFTRVPGGADPDLVRIIKEVDQRIRDYIAEQADDRGFQ